jgi:cytochrome b subunit of formate dehydrogenase
MSTNKGIKKSDLPTVLLHWFLVMTLFGSLITGLRISADAPDSVWAKTLGFLQLQGDVMHWHIWPAFALALIAVTYVVYLVRAKLAARIALDRTRIIHIRDKDPQTRWRSINIILYWVVFSLIALASVTGILLYFFSGLVAHSTVIAVHLAAAWLILLWMVFHISAQFIRGGIRQLLKILNPQAAYGSAALVAVGLASLVAFSVYQLDKTTIRSLNIHQTSRVPVIDGDPSDVAWQGADSVKIHTVRGANQPGGEVTVKVSMLHDNKDLYALFEWPDSTRSQKHLPLKKTAEGWVVVQTEFGIQDEDSYYEDKFGVMLSRSSQIAGAGTSHLGPKPLAHKPASSGGRGLHYTTDGSIADVWHWKSVRSGSTAMNQIDDNFFGPPLEPKNGGGRYTGGYSKDPKTGGGFKMNWEKYSDGIIQPLRLPKNPALLERLGNVDLDPTVSDAGEFWLPMEQTVPYTKELDTLDTYPIGTIMPSVLIKGPFQGDRGDVQAVTRWKEGWWRMEVKRKLDTGSKFDTAILKDTPTYLWVSAFDHAQTRHTIHLHPIRLVME